MNQDEEHRSTSQIGELQWRMGDPHPRGRRRHVARDKHPYLALYSNRPFPSAPERQIAISPHY